MEIEAKQQQQPTVAFENAIKYKMSHSISMRYAMCCIDNGLWNRVSSMPYVYYVCVCVCYTNYMRGLNEALILALAAVAMLMDLIQIDAMLCMLIKCCFTHW